MSCREARFTAYTRDSRSCFPTYGMRNCLLLFLLMFLSLYSSLLGPWLVGRRVLFGSHQQNTIHSRRCQLPRCINSSRTKRGAQDEVANLLSCVSAMLIPADYDLCGLGSSCFQPRVSRDTQPSVTWHTGLRWQLISGPDELTLSFLVSDKVIQMPGLLPAESFFPLFLYLFLMSHVVYCWSFTS